MSNLRRVLELYAGIGGMHFALNQYLESADLANQKVSFMAVDINPSAKLVYDANFPDSPMQQIDIRALEDRDFENLWLLTMSPPCQPFSRNGKVKDVEDFRCESFLFVLEVLSRLSNPPDYIMMENVKGFETSEACGRLKEVLRQQGYEYEEFLISPIDIGIPNSRLRYYLAASRFPVPSVNFQMSNFPLSGLLVDKDLHKVVPADWKNSSCDLETFLNFSEENDQFESLLVPLDILAKYLMVFDVKFRNSTTTNCFTKGYGRYFKGTGSIFCPLPEAEFGVLVREFLVESENERRNNILFSMKLRFFSPAEAALIMGFPPNFILSTETTDRMAWRLLGNSLNVKVVSFLFKRLFSPWEMIPA